MSLHFQRWTFHAAGHSHCLAISCIFKEATKDTLRLPVSPGILSNGGIQFQVLCVSFQCRGKWGRGSVYVSRDGIPDDFLPAILDQTESLLYASFVLQGASRRDFIFYVLVWAIRCSQIHKYLSQDNLHSKFLQLNSVSRGYRESPSSLISW